MASFFAREAFRCIAGLAEPAGYSAGPAISVPVSRRAHSPTQKRAGMPVELVEIEGAEHAFFNVSASSDAVTG